MLTNALASQAKIPAEEFHEVGAASGADRKAEMESQAKVPAGEVQDVGLSSAVDKKDQPQNAPIEPIDIEGQDEDMADGKIHELTQPADTSDVITHAIHLADDPSLQAITFRSMFLGEWLTLSTRSLSDKNRRRALDIRRRAFRHLLLQATNDCSSSSAACRSSLPAR